MALSTLAVLALGICLKFGGLSAAVLIPLPGTGRAEGVAYLDGTNFVASEFFTGDVFMIDAESRLATTIVRAPAGRYGIGLHASREHIFVAGGGPLTGFTGITPPTDGWMYAYDVATGEETVACRINGTSFINDVVADDTYAYYTDSVRPTVYRLRVSAMPSCDITSIPLPSAQFGGSGFSANGIAIYNDGLIISHTPLQTLFYVDFQRNYSVSRIAPEGLLPGVDGIFVKTQAFGTLLYVAETRASKISVWRLFKNNSKVSLRKVGDIVRRNQLATPTTVAVSDEYLMVANFNLSVPFPSPPGPKFNVFALKL